MQLRMAATDEILLNAVPEPLQIFIIFFIKGTVHEKISDYQSLLTPRLGEIFLEYINVQLIVFFSFYC